MDVPSDRIMGMEALIRWNDPQRGEVMPEDFIFVAEELGTGTYANLMAQYYVSGKVGQNGQYEEIARSIHQGEYERALALARELGLRLDPRSIGEGRRLARAI